MIDRSRKKWLASVNAALDKKAEDLVLLKMRGVASYADYVLMCSGRSDRQVQAIAQSIETELKKLGYRPLGIEGKSHGQWVLIDYGDVIIHVFQESVRKFYDLEGLWIDAPRVEVEPGRPVRKPRKREKRVASRQ
jgi:ribosome-associated protein